MKWLLLLAVVAALFGAFLIRFKSSHNNVCKTFDDYYSDRDNNPNCYHNPDQDLRVPDIIQGRGYPLETHHVGTEDGYILTMFRIPHGKDSKDKKPGPPVFIQHGITMNSGCFVNTGNKSLGFILADAGFDVWLGNFRGSLYSKDHSQLSDSDSKFWDFSFHEKGIYDLPAQLDLISSLTKQKITYIGFSMGAAMSYIYGITYPQIAQEQVKIFISLAPLAFLDEWDSLAKYSAWMIHYAQPLIQALTGNGELYARGKSHSSLMKFLCSQYPFQMKLCQVGDMFALGFDYEQNDPETLPVTILQNRDAVSVKSLIHCGQLIMNGGFTHFDYGAENNKKKYGSAKPPKYDFSKLKVPVYIVRGENDLMMSKKNIDQLFEALPDDVKRYGVDVVKHDKFNHADFLSARDVVPLVYEPLVNFIKKL